MSVAFLDSAARTAMSQEGSAVWVAGGFFEICLGQNALLSVSYYMAWMGTAHRGAAKDAERALRKTRVEKNGRRKRLPHNLYKRGFTWIGHIIHSGGR